MLRRNRDERLDPRLAERLNHGWVGQLARVLDQNHAAIFDVDFIDNRRGGGDEVEVVLPFQPLLDDLHVQQAEEAAPEAEAKRDGGLGFEPEGGVVELQLLERLAEVVVVRRIDGEDAAEHVGLHILEADQRLFAGRVVQRDRVADACELHIFDAGREEANVASLQEGHLRREGSKDANLDNIARCACGEHAHAVALLHAAVDHTNECNDAAEGIEPAVEHEQLKGCVGVALRRRNLLHNRFEDLVDADARFTRRRDGLRSIEADALFDVFPRALDVGARKVDLVEHRDDLEIVVEREVDIGKRLRLHALRRVDDQNGALTGGHASAHLVGEVDMSGRVDEVERVDLAIRSGEPKPHRLRLDGDAPLTLEVHVVEELGPHVAVCNPSGMLDEAVRQRRLSVVDVRDNGEVSDQLLRHDLPNGRTDTTGLPMRQSRLPVAARLLRGVRQGVNPLQRVLLARSARLR